MSIIPNPLDLIPNPFSPFLPKTPPADETLGQSAYDFTYRVFPEDLTSENQGHYMVININVPTKAGDTDDARSAYTGAKYRSSILAGERSKVDSLRFSNAGNLGGNQNERSVFVWQGPRNTRRVKESIALHMPNPVIYNTQNIYEEVSMTAIAGTIGTGLAKIGGALVGAAGRAGAAGAGPGSDIVGAIVDGAGNLIGTGSRLLGYPINPRVEVLYATTPQRQFVFEIMMAPRNEAESETIKEIVKTLRFHSAPELSTIGGLVPSFIPPAEFDITFYNKGVENTNIPRINTCLLERIEVDYAPTGMYSTFRNGHPVAVRLSLGFREVEIIHKLRVIQGF